MGLCIQFVGLTKTSEPSTTAISLSTPSSFSLSLCLQRPFKGGVLTPPQQDFNTSMSTVRSSVEWIFGNIVNYFKFLDFKKNLKIGLSAVGKMYVTCALMQNAHSILYGTVISEYFGLNPPTLEEYYI